MKKLLIILLLPLFGCASVSSLIENSEAYATKATRTKYIQEHPDTPKDIQTFILDGKITQGMTKEQVRASWGKPSQVMTSSQGVDSWSYHSTNFLYFYNDKLANWTQTQ